MTMRAPPTLSEPIIVGQFWRNRAGEAITIQLSTYQGRNVIDLRVWRSIDGRLRPTTKGLCVEAKHLPTLQKALGRAAATARELGLIATDDNGADQ